MNSQGTFLTTAAVLLSASLLAQDAVVHRELNWTSPADQKNEKTSGPLQVTFEKAGMDASRSDLPYYAENIPLGRNVVGYTAYLRNLQFEDLSAQEVKALPGLNTVDGTIELQQSLGWHRKGAVAMVVLVPFRRSGKGGYQKLVAFDLELVKTLGTKVGGGAPKSPNQSKMATGDWYRFTVAKDGVYRLNYAFLGSLGVDLNNLSSDQINIYGNHHGMLPFQNSELPDTDLFLNAIQVNDGGDGQFGPNDHILFYASGAQKWEWDASDGRFIHTKNVYSDSASYFIGIGVEPAARIMDLPGPSIAPTHQVSRFLDRQFHERDVRNLIKSGREFYGELFDIETQYTFSFDVPFALSSDTSCLVVDVIARTSGTSNASTFNISAGALNASLAVPGVNTSNYNGPFAQPARGKYFLNNGLSNLIVTLDFQQHDPISSVGWLNYLELNAWRELKMVGSQLAFREPTVVGSGNIAEYQLDQAQTVSRIWDITDPLNVRNIPFQDNGAIKSFTTHADTIREFIALKNSGFLTPTPIGPVANQNIHGWQGVVDMVIVAPSNFIPEVERLAQVRVQEGLNVQIVTPQQVFNEFSSGARDATAIKRMMKLLYDRAGSDPLAMPRYLLLAGDGSYDNVNLNSTNQNIIPTYQTANSWDLSFSYCSEDYFGLLDDNEGEATGDLVDIGIGRLPASNVLQLRGMIDKVLAYNELKLINAATGQCQELEGSCVKDWRTRVMFISDDQEGAALEGPVHMSNSDALANKVEQEHPCYNVDKIYMDAYLQESTPGGERYPDATQEFKEKVQNGLLLVNYVGHGGEVGWGHERFLDLNTILDWSNGSCLPLFMTATCEFSRWDDPGRTSAGEYVVLNANGGGIALMTTTRLAYSSSNQRLSSFFYDHVLDRVEDEGRTMRFGDIFRLTKRDIAADQPGSRNHRNFCLLGDPSTTLAQPQWQVMTTSVTDTVGTPTDTLRALAHVTVKGIVADDSGQRINGFNGVVVPTVFDKRINITTLANDGGTPYNYNMWKNVIYRGQATVRDGEFEFTFVVPKDIAYQIGPGRIAYYAESASSNAFGCSDDKFVGGSDPNAALDDEGPQVNLYMNNENFVRGGITDDSPFLFAKVFDASGINTLGNSIGHDIKAVLDERTDRSVNLNDFYEADLDTYQSGTVRYRFSDLKEGPHRLDLKVWDVHNNSSNAFTEFVVSPSAELALDHVLNYPNPFTTRTEFYFEHNKACEFLDVQVQVFTVSGKLVKTLNNRVHTPGFRSDPIVWNGLDDHGDKLGRGVYVYRLNVVTPDGEQAEEFEKLVILQ